MHGKVIMVLSLAVLVGCQASNEVNVPDTGDVNNQVVRLPQEGGKCGSPPVLDKAAIARMLERSGKITQDMSEAERERIVDEFIARKQAAYQCKAKTPDTKTTD